MKHALCSQHDKIQYVPTTKITHFLFDKHMNAEIWNITKKLIWTI